MKELYKDLLFRKHYLVSDHDENDVTAFGENTSAFRFNIAMTLAGKFGIRVRGNVLNATISMIKDAERNLGIYVPEPFYRNFPYSVRALTPDQLYYDQMLHYTQTYGLGWWDNLGHSSLEPREDVFIRRAFNEKVEPKDFNIITPSEAVSLIKEYTKDILSSNRPLDLANLVFVAEAVRDFSYDILPDRIPCKITVIYLMYQFRDPYFCKYLKLSDTIKLLGFIQYNVYNSENLKKLNLKNKDRKFLTDVLMEFERLEESQCNMTYFDFKDCFEKHKIWCGFLHHIHYRGKTTAMRNFMRDIRNGKNFSVYHDFEYHMERGEYGIAARQLVQFKGKSELVRHLNYILSRCGSEHDIEEVLSWLN